ncbi:MAG TPA: agmatine deiminase family protein [Candidatus Binatia bacterium]|nr:agmatine deiminase family protein [Candidatus Binatia bacterium]
MPDIFRKFSETPAALGYRMPAEWEPHEATWMAWPHNRSDWPGKFEGVPWIYAEIVRHLARRERVNILVQDEASETKARAVLVRSHVLRQKASAPGKPAGNVRFLRIPTDRVWTRDYGPIFVRREQRKRDLAAVAATVWRFNAWAKYSDWRLDALAGAGIAANLKIPAWQPHLRLNGEMRQLVLEGGSIDVNGRGTLITTEECLLGDVQQRNPGFSREHLEEAFADYLGIEKVIWLEHGIAGDDTHGHVDDVTRFVGPRTVVTAYEPDPDDPNHEPLSENFRWLKKSTDQSGKPLKVVKLPMPAPVHFEGQRLPASYANFYIANGLVLVPVFGDPHDRVALDILAELFPEREVIGIYCRDFIWGLGAVHCMTQQQPAQ